MEQQDNYKETRETRRDLEGLKKMAKINVMPRIPKKLKF